MIGGIASQHRCLTARQVRACAVISSKSTMEVPRLVFCPLQWLARTCDPMQSSLHYIPVSSQTLLGWAYSEADMLSTALTSSSGAMRLLPMVHHLAHLGASGQLRMSCAPPESGALVFLKRDERWVIGTLRIVIRREACTFLREPSRCQAEAKMLEGGPKLQINNRWRDPW